ncbi:hypothetical protein BLNAU_13860 [Blattamonas nauphoetae]|uniref:Uncharacterized protein n=1 Tax=Blattamonas nauphoetae TaxID=2049346 RepID=A0ABQ9XHR1_9EUKA|nr:hypothetical protein BLNAU_13860 [Blattamonas nauphoetae]
MLFAHPPLHHLPLDASLSSQYHPKKAVIFATPHSPDNSTSHGESSALRCIINVSWVSLVVLLAASVDNSVSEAAVSLLATESKLTSKQTRALLFSTPTTFPVSPDWPLPVYNQHNPSQKPPPSLCAEAGRLLSERRDEKVEFERLSEHQISEEIITLFGSCLISALHSNNPLVSSRIPIFAKELWTDNERQRFWSNAEDSETVNHLLTLTFTSIACPSRHNLRTSSDEDAVMFSSGWLFYLHTFPFISGKPGFTGHSDHLRHLHHCYTLRPDEKQHFWKIVSDVLFSRSVNTPLQSLRTIYYLLAAPSPITRRPWRMDEDFINQSTTLRQRLKTAEGDEKWDLFTRLWVLGHISEEETDEMVMLAETDEQLLLALSLPNCTDTSIEYQSEVVMNERSVHRLMKAAGRTDNL